MNEYERKLAKPGEDPLAYQQQREADYWNPLARQERSQQLKSDLFALKKERDYLDNNPGTTDIYNVLDEQKTKKKKYSGFFI